MFRGFTRREHFLTLAIVGFLFLGLGVRHFREETRFVPRIQEVHGSPALSSSAEVSDGEGDDPSAGLRIDLNTASAELLEGLPGLGPSKSEAVVEYRSRFGPFRRVEDVESVPGIGPKTLESVRRYLVVAHEDGLPPDSGLDGRTGPPAIQSGLLSGGPAGAGSGPVNINVATAEELQMLDGVGPVIAARIVAYRATYGAFRHPEDLMRVKGIGPKTLARNRTRIRLH